MSELCVGLSKCKRAQPWLLLTAPDNLSFMISVYCCNFLHKSAFPG